MFCMVIFFVKSENMVIQKFAHSSASAFPSGDIRFEKSINWSKPITPEPAVVGVGDCEMVFILSFSHDHRYIQNF